jgi:hypothetical protein
VAITDDVVGHVFGKQEQVGSSSVLGIENTHSPQSVNANGRERPQRRWCHFPDD